MIRFEVDTIFAVRPHKGERRHKGRLLKTSIHYADTLEAARADVREPLEGYSQHIAFRAYDADAFAADPLNAKPFWTA